MEGEDHKTLRKAAVEIISIGSYGRDNGSIETFQADENPNRIFYVDCLQRREDYSEKKVLDKFSEISKQLYSIARFTIGREIYNANLKKVEGHALLADLYCKTFLIGVYNEDKCVIQNPHFFIEDLPKQSFLSIIKSLVESKIKLRDI